MIKSLGQRRDTLSDQRWRQGRARLRLYNIAIETYSFLGSDNNHYPPGDARIGYETLPPGESEDGISRTDGFRNAEEGKVS